MSTGFVFLDVETWKRAERMMTPGLSNPVSAALDELQEFRDGKRVVVNGREVQLGDGEYIAAVDVDSNAPTGPSTEAANKARGQIANCAPLIEAYYVSLGRIPWEEMSAGGYELDRVTNAWHHTGGPLAMATNIPPPVHLWPEPNDLIKHVQRALGDDTADVRIDQSSTDYNHGPEIVVTIGPTITLDQRQAVLDALAKLIPVHAKTTVVAEVALPGPIKQLTVGPPIDDKMGPWGIPWSTLLGPIKAESPRPDPTPTAKAETRCPNCHGAGECEPLFFGAPYPCRKCGGSGTVE